MPGRSQSPSGVGNIPSGHVVVKFGVQPATDQTKPGPQSMADPFPATGSHTVPFHPYPSSQMDSINSQSVEFPAGSPQSVDVARTNGSKHSATTCHRITASLETSTTTHRDKHGTTAFQTMALMDLKGNAPSRSATDVATNGVDRDSAGRVGTFGLEFINTSLITQSCIVWTIKLVNIKHCVGRETSNTSTASLGNQPTPKSPERQNLFSTNLGPCLPTGRCCTPSFIHITVYIHSMTENLCEAHGITLEIGRMNSGSFANKPAK